jgi:large subunit ribosomal protein L25
LAEGQSIKVTVPVHVVGQEASPGLKRGGALQVVEHAIELLVPVDAIPDSVDVSIAELDIGGTIHLSDVALPEGAKAVAQDDVTLVTVVAPSGMNEDTAAGAGDAAEAEPAKA